MRMVSASRTLRVRPNETEIDSFGNVLRPYSVWFPCSLGRNSAKADSLALSVAGRTARCEQKRTTVCTCTYPFRLRSLRHNFETRVNTLRRKLYRVTKIQNEIVAVPTGVMLPIHFEFIVRRETHNALIGSSGCKDVLVLREGK